MELINATPPSERNVFKNIFSKICKNIFFIAKGFSFATHLNFGGLNPEMERDAPQWNHNEFNCPGFAKSKF